MLEAVAKKILVVDDEKVIRSFLSDVLTDAGYSVTAAASGKEALNLTRRFKPDLIILDLVLPDMGGSNIASHFKDNPSTAATPIIFLSGIINKEQEKSILETDIMQYTIPKPVERDKLLEAVNKFLPR